MEDIVKFKHLLEYFVAHLNFVQSNPKKNFSINNIHKTEGYDQYVKKYIEPNVILSWVGQGYNGNQIQKQIEDWENYEFGKVTITIEGHYSDYKAKTCYLNWKGVGINIYAIWNNDKVDSLYIKHYFRWETDSKSKYSESLIEKKVSELGLFDGDTITPSLRDFYNFFMKEKNDYNNRQGSYYEREKIYKQSMQTDRLWMWNKSDIWNDGVAAFSTNILKMGDSAQGKLDFATIETKDDLRIAYQAIVENTDVVIPNMYWQFMNEVQQNDIVVVFETIKEGGKLNHLLYGWGRFTSDCKIVATDNNPLQREVEWHLPPLSEPVKETTTSNSIYFHLIEGTEATNIKKLLGIDVNKSYWLLSWNPENWEWKEYSEWAKGTKSGKTYNMSWTCNSKQPKIGDHIFLMKTGTEPRGIVAHGKVVRQSYEAPHYDSEKAAAGKTAPHIDVEFDGIRNYTTESILQIDTLTQRFPEQTWNPQSSGIQIKCDVNELQKTWVELQENQINTIMKKYVNLLKSNHNLILTGAPGTGKTYLAKQIAQQMIFGKVIKGEMNDEEQKQFNEQCGFVQFHPSYDYTDFVEGLRPKNENGNVGFERKDGVFKEFCAKALSFNTKYEWLINHLQTRQAPIVLERPRSESFEVTVDNSTLRINGESVTKELFKSYYDGTKTDRWFNTHFKKILDYIDKNYSVVFIIDEVNRGEINKIFGELFFSIDPGYRGEKGRVQTQYQNMVKDGDLFRKGFFVPENVYIIGTMNDIDRSVESMDFAFRRRFAFVEIKADENVGMLDDLEWKDEAIARMERLNNAISEIEGLSSAYHIGASYFLKLKNYDGDFDKLWKYHLEGLLFEYLRGVPGVNEKLEQLKAAYNNESNPDNGQ